jgi:proline dehydrogenase
MSSAVAARGLRLPVSHAPKTALALQARAVPSSHVQPWSAPIVAAVTVNHRRGFNVKTTITSPHTHNAHAQAHAHSHDGALTSSSPSTHSAHSSSSTSRRHIHSSQRRTSTLAEHPDALIPPAMEPSRAPLSVLPLSVIIRSLGTTTVSSSPLLLGPSLRIMAALAHSRNPILNPDYNPLLRFFLKKTFYAQFCAGENSLEVRHTIDGLKNIGYTGVILGYAREVVLSETQAQALADGKIGEETDEIIRNEIAPWAEGTLETVQLAQPGDFVALK